MKRLFYAIILTIICPILANGQVRKYHDALIFELIDHPEYVITKEGLIVFNEDGSLNKKRSTALEGYAKYQISRDSKGYPTKVTTENETITFKLDEMHMMLERHVKGAENYSEIFVRSQVNENETTPRHSMVMTSLHHIHFTHSETKQQVTTGAVFRYNGLQRHIYNNSVKIITYY